MKLLKTLLPAALAALVLLPACKTTEENYRSAYEKAIAGRDSMESLENTIYGRERRQVGFQYMAVGGDTIPVMNRLVRMTEGGGGLRENLRPYCVVIGQFKQRFNAISMRDRLAVAEATVPTAFVVETGEPYYYVIASSWPTLAEAAAALKTLQTNPPIPLRPPLPYILRPTAK